MIKQGSIYWIRPEALQPAAPGRRRPHVVIQADVLNQSRIPTVVVCALSTNMRRTEEPGNVLLDADEAGLTKASVVVVSQVSVVKKGDLEVFVGCLDERRIAQILSGMRFLQRAFRRG